MPQLSPLPWLVFVMVSFFPMIFVVMISEMLFNKVGVLDKLDVILVKFKW